MPSVPTFRAAALAAMTLTLSLTACGGGEDAAAAAGAPGALNADQIEAGMPDGHPSTEGTAPAIALAFRTALDSGNALFRAKDYAGALAQYRIAAKDTANPAGLIGMSMVAAKTNNTALADSIGKALEAQGLNSSAHDMSGGATGGMGGMMPPASGPSPHGKVPPLPLEGKKSS